MESQLSKISFIQCNYCSQIYKGKEAFNEHKKTVHYKGSIQGYWKELRRKSKKENLKGEELKNVKVKEEPLPPPPPPLPPLPVPLLQPSKELPKKSATITKLASKEAEVITLSDSEEEEYIPPPVLTKFDEELDPALVNEPIATILKAIQSPPHSTKRQSLDLNVQDDISLPFKLNTQSKTPYLDILFNLDNISEKTSDVAGPATISSTLEEAPNLLNLLNEELVVQIHDETKGDEGIDEGIVEDAGENEMHFDSGISDVSENRSLPSISPMTLSFPGKPSFKRKLDWNLLNSNSIHPIPRSSKYLRGEFTCQLCGSNFRGKKWLENHLTRAHNLPDTLSGPPTAISESLRNANSKVNAFYLPSVQDNEDSSLDEQIKPKSSHTPQTLEPPDSSASFEIFEFEELDTPPPIKIKYPGIKSPPKIQSSKFKRGRGRPRKDGGSPRPSDRGILGKPEDSRLMQWRKKIKSPTKGPPLEFKAPKPVKYSQNNRRNNKNKNNKKGKSLKDAYSERIVLKALKKIYAQLKASINQPIQPIQPIDLSSTSTMSNPELSANNDLPNTDSVSNFIINSRISIQNPSSNDLNNRKLIKIKNKIAAKKRIIKRLKRNSKKENSMVRFFSCPFTDCLKSYTQTNKLQAHIEFFHKDTRKYCIRSKTLINQNHNEKEIELELEDSALD